MNYILIKNRGGRECGCSANVANRSLRASGRGRAGALQGPARACGFSDIALGTAELPLQLTGQLLLSAGALPSGPSCHWGLPPCAHSISNKELSELIEQLQKNADQVERNIVDTEAKMQSVSAPPPRGPPAPPAPLRTKVLRDPVASHLGVILPCRGRVVRSGDVTQPQRSAELGWRNSEERPGGL